MRALHHEDEMVRIDGLGEEVHRAFLNRGHRVLDAAVRRHHHDLQLGIELFGRAQHAQSVSRRKLQVGQDDGGTGLAHVLDGSGSSSRLENDVPLPLERMPEHRPERVLVFNEKNGEGGQWVLIFDARL